MNAKYADVVQTSEALTFLDSLKPGLFELPKGAMATAPGARARMAARA
jgi:hypothetical protein